MTVARAPLSLPSPTGMAEMDMISDVRADAAAALRRMGHALVSHEADDELLRRVAAAAERVTRDLEAAPRRERDLLALKQSMFPQEVPDRERISHFPECFVSGVHNPMGIAIDVFREGDGVVANVELDWAFEGAPGRSHGGIVAAIFDDVLGYLLTVIQEPAFTGELTVRYHAATPIREPLTFRAEVTGREGRRVFTRAEATREDGSVVASATATFITVDVSHFRA